MAAFRSLIDRHEYLALFVLVTLAVAMFAPSLGYALTFDDLGTVVEHPGVKAPSFGNLFLRDFWGHRFGDPEGVPTVRPLVTFSYSLDQRLGHGAPWAFHASNLVFYALLLVLLHRLLRVWAGDALRAPQRLFATAAFAALAIHADVVPSVTGRAEILAMTCLVLALQLAREESASLAVAGSGLACLLALLCKESALPMVLVLPWLCLRCGVSRRRVLGLSALVAASVLGFVTYRVQAGFGFRARFPGVEESNTLFLSAGFFARLPGAMDVLAHYGFHSVSGVELCADHGYADFVPSTTWLALGPVLGALLALAGVAAIVATFRRAPRVADALVAFGASYAVASSVLVPASAGLADRLFFFPSFWLVVVVALLLARAPARVARLSVPIVAVFLVGQSALAVLASRMWRDEKSLALHTVTNCPHNGRGRQMRAHVAWLDRDVEMTAWQLVARAALYNQFPAAVPEEQLASEWEELPFAQRIALLRKALPPEKYEKAVLRGVYLARTGGYREAEAYLLRTLVPTLRPGPSG